MNLELIFEIKGIGKMDKKMVLVEMSMAVRPIITKVIT